MKVGLRKDECILPALNTLGAFYFQLIKIVFMRIELFTNGDYYHIFNRGVDHRDIFIDDVDRERFVRSLIAFNTTETDVTPPLYRLHTRPEVSKSPIVRIMSYTLMPNHFHLLFEQLVENGISNFMQKLSGGYARYFNRRHARTGSLCEGEYQAVPIKSNAQLYHISRYIHLNQLSLLIPEWEQRGVSDWDKAEEFLEGYVWSSYRSYIGLENEDFIDPGVLRTMFDGPNDYRQFMKEWAMRGTEFPARKIRQTQGLSEKHALLGTQFRASNEKDFEEKVLHGHLEINRRQASSAFFYNVLLKSNRNQTNNKHSNTRSNSDADAPRPQISNVAIRRLGDSPKKHGQDKTFKPYGPRSNDICKFIIRRER